MRTVLITLIVLASSAPPVLARTWRVYEDGSGHAPTVQAAIDSAGDGDVVLVGPGKYYENLNLLGKAIELRSSGGSEATILDGSLGDNSVIICDSGESSATLIAGFTITGGTGYPRTPYSRIGGGIHCLNSCPRIEGNIIRGNSSVGEIFDSRGGGISFGGPNQCKINIRNNIIEKNTAKSNGGGVNIAGPCVIEGNVFRRNRTLNGDGGGIDNRTAQDVQIRSNLFLENEAADHGGAIHLALAFGAPQGVEILRNIIVGNVARGEEGAPDCSGGAIYLQAAGAIVQSNTIAFNSADEAGGLCFVDTFSGVSIEKNILFRNNGAIRTFSYSALSRGTVRRNLFFDNGRIEIEDDGSSLIVEENLFTDPLFCLWSLDSRGEISRISPALNGPYGVIGAVEEGSCGPEICCVDVVPITWGRLKARYR
jgi:hypothetical protein